MEIKRKIDAFLADWKARADHKPLIVKGARQIGKTFSVTKFAKNNYAHVVEVNFALQPKYASIFEDGYEVGNILKNLSLLNPKLNFVPHETLFFFDEIQQQPAVATCLKAFCIDGRYDVICSGSLMGISYKEIESNSVGYKEDFDMKSMDFEEFLWAKGFLDEQINGIFEKMLRVELLSQTEVDVMSAAFRDYVVVGGMPAIVKKYLENDTFAGVLEMQRQLLRDYDEDITKYAVGLDKAKVKAVYNHIPVFLGQPNKKFQISKVARGARGREYVGTVEWLADAGVVNICYCMGEPSLPLKGNYIHNNYKIYYHDTGLLIASLDEEAQRDLRENKNFNTYKGAVFENVVAEMLVKQGYSLFFYRNEKSTVEMDFFVRDTESLIPVEVKAQDCATASLNKMIGDDEKYPDIKYGIKLANKNIGFNGKFYTFPYFLTFLLKRFLGQRRAINVFY